MSIDHISILIAEDSPRDSLEIASAAQQWGTTVRVSTFQDLIAALESGNRFDLLILDLKIGTSEPRNTVQAVRVATSHLRLPVIVVTGYPDEDLKRDCETFGWRWIDKDSQRFKAKLYQAIDKAINSEDSGARRAKDSSQLEAIVAKLDRMEQSQQAMSEQLREIAETVEDVLTRMFGKKNKVGGRDGGGCAEICQQTKSVFDAGRAWLFAAMIGTAGAVASLVSWFFSKVTQ
jgi:CheY-like chemotaxis protein